MSIVISYFESVADGDRLGKQWIKRTDVKDWEVWYQDMHGITMLVSKKNKVGIIEDSLFKTLGIWPLKTTNKVLKTCGYVKICNIK